MKGAVFIAFETMVVDTFGMKTWEQLLDDVQPPSKGIYTATTSYQDQELLDLVAHLAQISQTPMAQLVEQFGFELFKGLNRAYPQFSQSKAHFFEFLESIDGVIHLEVKKLYQDPNLPSIQCQRLSDTQMLLSYQSPRQLCILAEGLIRGAALHYQQGYRLDHEQCMHDGHDCCHMRITLDEQ